MRNLMILARWLAGRAEIDVVECESNTAWIGLSGGRRVIHIPRQWSYTSDPEAHDLLEGVIDHEALGHGRYTDLEGRSKAEEQGLIKFTAFSSGLQNILEDVYIERKAIETYPGVKANFAKTVKILAGRKFFGDKEAFEKSGKPQLVTGGLLNVLRYRLVPGQQEALEANVQAIEPILQDVLGSLWEEILAIAMEVEHSTCTHDNILLTVRIMELLESLAKQDQTQGGQEQGGEGGESTQDPDAQNAEGGQETGQPESSPPSCPVPGSGDPDGSKRSASSSAAQEILDGQTQAMPSTEVTDGLSKELGKMVAAAARSAEMKNVSATKPMSSSALRLCSQVRNSADDLQEALLAQTACEKSNGLVGKRLQGRILSRVKVGNARVFSRKHEAEGVSTAVHILVDQSASMDEALLDGVSRMDAAMGLTYGVSDLLNEFDIPFQINTYSNDYATLKRFDQDWTAIRRKAERPSLSGSTYTGQAMEKALSDLVQQPQERKLLLVLTDGESADPARLFSCYSEAQQMGIEVASIMIGPKVRAIDELARKFGFEAKSLNTSTGLGRYAVERVLAAI